MSMNSSFISTRSVSFSCQSLLLSLTKIPSNTQSKTTLLIPDTIQMNLITLRLIEIGNVIKKQWKIFSSSDN